MNYIVTISLIIYIGLLSSWIDDDKLEQQQQIDTLTARVLMLENTLSDKSGIKPEAKK